MSAQVDDRRNSQQIRSELQALRSGVVDTSTLIYLDHLNIISMISQTIQLLVIPQVIAEFGCQPAGTHHIAAEGNKTADIAVLEAALRLRQPLFSEDGHLLRQARQHHHPHYNTLMLLLALRTQQIISDARFRELSTTLRHIARYSAAVWAHGDAVFQILQTWENRK